MTAASKHIPFFSSLQIKYAMSYLAIFAVVLILLNTYPVLASQQLLFSSKRDALKSQTSVMASALMELETLTPDQVARVMNMLDSTGLSRVLVTDPAGQILYDSWLAQGESGETSGAVSADAPPRYALIQEVVLALENRDVFYSRYESGTFISISAAPIIYRTMTIGAICVMETDLTQGALLLNLQQNLNRISLIIALVTLVMSTVFSRMLTARITALLKAIRIVGQGNYGHRLTLGGRDELTDLAEEFNQLSDRLQTTEEVRRRFVSDASHELKTPLASIRLLADSILQNQNMDAETARDFVSDIGTEAERLTRITEHLLALTRLDSLPVTDTTAVDMGAVAGHAAAMLAPVAQAAQVTIQTDLPTGCLIRCTEDDLYQVCYNLVENAIKYNLPQGEVLVRVRRQEESVVLEVLDTGVGIPEEDMPKVFSRFYRVDKARSRAAGGTGLGLSIVRDTVRRHGGWVNVRARIPRGCIFTAGFPPYAPQDGTGGGLE